MTVADVLESSISIRATPAQIMAVIADFDAYPDWAGVKSATVLETGGDGRASQVNLIIDAGFAKDDYVLAYDWEDDRRVSWKLVRGKAQKAQEGTYSLEHNGDETAVTYRLALELAIPLPGLLKRKGQRVVMDTALKGLKKRVETLG